MTHSFPLTHREVTVEPIPLDEQTPCYSSGSRRRGPPVIHGTSTVRQIVRVTDTGQTSGPHDFCEACNASTLAMFARQEKAKQRAARKAAPSTPTAVA